jgi:integral membrane protein
MNFSWDTWLNRFRSVAFLEGVSFLLLLFIAMPLKYLAGMPLGVKVVGMAHGVLVIAYCLLLAVVHAENNWTLRKTVLSLLVSLLPFGTFYAEKHWWKS